MRQLLRTVPRFVKYLGGRNHGLGSITNRNRNANTVELFVKKDSAQLMANSATHAVKWTTLHPSACNVDKERNGNVTEYIKWKQIQAYLVTMTPMCQMWTSLQTWTRFRRKVSYRCWSLNKTNWFDFNEIPEKYVSKQLVNTQDKKLTLYDNSTINALWTCTLEIKNPKNQRRYNVNFVIVILSLCWAHLLFSICIYSRFSITIFCQ